MSESGPVTNSLWMLRTTTGPLRVEVPGQAEKVRDLQRLVSEHPGEQLSREGLLAWLRTVAADLNVDVGQHDSATTSYSRDLAKLICAIQTSRSAGKAYIPSLSPLEIAGETEVDDLRRSRDLPDVQEYLQGVLADLDENAEEARKEMRGHLAPVAGAVLVPEPISSDGE